MSLPVRRASFANILLSASLKLDAVPMRTRVASVPLTEIRGEAAAPGAYTGVGGRFAGGSGAPEWSVAAPAVGGRFPHPSTNKPLVDPRAGEVVPSLGIGRPGSRWPPNVRRPESGLRSRAECHSSSIRG